VARLRELRLPLTPLCYLHSPRNDFSKKTKIVERSEIYRDHRARRNGKRSLSAAKQQAVVERSRNAAGCFVREYYPTFAPKQHHHVPTTQPRLLWQPTQSPTPNLLRYMAWLAQHPQYDIETRDYHALWQWSTDHLDLFWQSIWDYFKVMADGEAKHVLHGEMPQARWFEGTKVNYAEHVFRQYSDERPAILFGNETDATMQAISWAELRQKTASFAQWLQNQGVVEGDRVVGYLPNIPEATIAFLATASLGAVWSSASPDFGAASVLERFGQITPKVLVAVNGYHYGGKTFDKTEVVAELQAEMPSLVNTVLINYVSAMNPLPNSTSWTDTVADTQAQLQFARVDFAAPLWVLYSSGTTGAPKAIVHGQGGMLLEHLKYGTFHNDVHPGERFFWYTTTGWMMWNYLNAMLLAGATIVLYDGSPGHPDMGVLWQMVARERVQHMGVSAAYILAVMKAGFVPKSLDMSHLRSIGSTGSPLPPEGFDWIYDQVKSDVWLTSMSGGTDVCTAFVGGNPLWPVHEGEIQCRALGCAMESWNEQGQPMQDEVGEMVVTRPMPCMPIGFWNDPDRNKYRSSYFEDFEGVWRHGDWLRITPRQGLVILGRSDATLNRQGIRIGTSEIYRSVEQLPEVRDSLIINIEKEDGDSYMPLFVALKPGFLLDEALKKRIAQQLRADYSPRHVPDAIIEVPDIPYTISGKKLELPVKKLLMGKPLEKAVNLGSVRNPQAFMFFEGYRY
jgi:acetoacetyl-CoA synthetase